MDPDPAATVADGVTRQLDPRWVTVQRIHSAIAGVILTTASFAGVMVLWAGRRNADCGSVPSSVVGTAHGIARVAPVPMARDRLWFRVVPRRR